MNKKNILFVDDNENVISGIQRQLRPYRNCWQLFFARTGEQALELMAEQSIDLIISEIMLPEMRGDELLAKIMEQHPATVRMIFSGYTSEESLQKALEYAHQYLTKPCTPENLHEAILQIFTIQTCINNPLIISELGDINQLPSLPKIYRELNAAIADENSTPRSIADIFSKDPGLSAKLLQLINSPYFGMNRIVSSLSEAINLIGIKRLNSLLLSAHLRAQFPASDAETALYMEYIWQDAAKVSELARLIALSENQQEDRPDQAYLGGLLHNIGLLIFLSRRGNKLKTFLEQVKHTDIPIRQLETNIFGFTAPEAAAYLLSLWKIPPRIIEAILLQNSPNQTDYDGMNALTAVHAAACLIKHVSADFERLFNIQLDQAYLERLGKTDRIADWQRLANKVMASHIKK